SGDGSPEPAVWWSRRRRNALVTAKPEATWTGRRSQPTTRSSRLNSRPGRSGTKTRANETNVEAMAVDTTPTERALGSMGTGFRLTRLYPATHPAVQESLRQITASLPPLAGLGTLEWKVGATGLHW